MTKHPADTIPKEKLLQMIKRLLNARDDLGFLVRLEQGDLERLLVATRARVEGSDRSA